MYVSFCSLSVTICASAEIHTDKCSPYLLLVYEVGLKPQRFTNTFKVCIYLSLYLFACLSVFCIYVYIICPFFVFMSTYYVLFLYLCLVHMSFFCPYVYVLVCPFFVFMSVYDFFLLLFISNVVSLWVCECRSISWMFFFVFLYEFFFVCFWDFFYGFL